MSIGEKRHRVTIQQKTISRDNPERIAVESWVDVATIWAAVEPLRGREFFQAQAINAEVTTLIRIRYRSGVLASMRILFDGVQYNILSVIDVNSQHRELHLMCKELV